MLMQSNEWQICHIDVVPDGMEVNHFALGTRKTFVQWSAKNSIRKRSNHANGTAYLFIGLFAMHIEWNACTFPDAE